MGWMLIEKLNDNDKIYAGSCIRFYNTEKGLKEQCALPCDVDGFLDYFISEIYDNSEYYQLTCLSIWEGGNITCVIKRENGNYFILGEELKRVLQTDLYKVFINQEPKIHIK